MPVLYGVFLYMGVASLNGVQVSQSANWSMKYIYYCSAEVDNWWVCVEIIFQGALIFQQIKCDLN